MTTNDIQNIVFKYLVGRYYSLSINGDSLVDNNPDKELMVLPSFVVKVEMFDDQFVAFRKDCQEAGLDIMATWDEFDSFTIIATERL